MRFFTICLVSFILGIVYCQANDKPDTKNNEVNVQSDQEVKKPEGRWLSEEEIKGMKDEKFEQLLQEGKIPVKEVKGKRWYWWGGCGWGGWGGWGMWGWPYWGWGSGWGCWC